MSKIGPIILADDDADDCHLIKAAFQEMKIPNEVICIHTGKEVLAFLRETNKQPFLILSDINMPAINGIELRKQIIADPYLRKKSIPFVYITTSPVKSSVFEAYEMNVQGFFEKSQTYEGLKNMLRQIYEYWQNCWHPNNFTAI